MTLASCLGFLCLGFLACEMGPQEGTVGGPAILSFPGSSVPTQVSQGHLLTVLFSDPSFSLPT